MQLYNVRCCNFLIPFSLLYLLLHQRPKPIAIPFKAAKIYEQILNQKQLRSSIPCVRQHTYIVVPTSRKRYCAVSRTCEVDLKIFKSSVNVRQNTEISLVLD